MKVFDELSFGKFKGVELGMVYLTEPSYVMWMIENTANFIEDIEIINGLNVVLPDGGFGGWHNEQGKDPDKIPANFLSNFFSFIDLKNSGLVTYKIPDKILEINDRKRPFSNIEKTTENYCEAIYLEFNFLGIKLPPSNFKLIDAEQISKGHYFIEVEFNNSENKIPALPKRENLILRFLCNPNWDIYTKNEDYIIINGIGDNILLSMDGNIGNMPNFANFHSNEIH